MAIATSNITQAPTTQIGDEFDELRERIEGTVVTPDDADYEDVRQVQVAHYNRKPEARSCGRRARRTLPRRCGSRPSAGCRWRCAAAGTAFRG